jgi:hypothetical protein
MGKLYSTPVELSSTVPDTGTRQRETGDCLKGGIIQETALWWIIPWS